jgi:hypothetical protein
MVRVDPLTVATSVSVLVKLIGSPEEAEAEDRLMVDTVVLTSAMGGKVMVCDRFSVMVRLKVVLLAAEKWESPAWLKVRVTVPAPLGASLPPVTSSTAELVLA